MRLVSDPLGDEQGGDQEARQHEEGVDPEEPRRQEREAPVVGHDGQDGQGPDAVEGRHVARGAGCRRV